MKKIALILALVLLSACLKPSEPIKDGSGSTTQENVGAQYDVAGYDISTDETKSYLTYKDQKIFELGSAPSGASDSEYLIYHVYYGQEEDFVYTVVGQGCGGCVGFPDEYYVVNHADLSVEPVAFEDVPGEGKASPANALFSDGNNEMSVIESYGTFGEPDYYEEVWTYTFDENKWKLAETTEKNHTFMCLGMGYNLDNNKIGYLQGDLITTPAEIVGRMVCDNPDTILYRIGTHLTFGLPNSDDYTNSSAAGEGTASFTIKDKNSDLKVRFTLKTDLSQMEGLEDWDIEPLSVSDLLKGYSDSYGAKSCDAKFADKGAECRMNRVDVVEVIPLENQGDPSIDEYLIVEYPYGKGPKVAELVHIFESINLDPTDQELASAVSVSF